MRRPRLALEGPRPARPALEAARFSYWSGSPGDPRGFKVALRFDTAVLPWAQGNNTGTLLALTPRSNEKEIAQLIEITTILHFPRLGLT